MRMTIIVNKFFSVGKWVVGIVLLTFSLNAFAEYYLVYSAPEFYPTCISCYKPKPHRVYHKYKRVHKKIVHKKIIHKRSTCSMAVYYVSQAPTCGCATCPSQRVWVNGYYSDCGQWVPGHWRARSEEVMYLEPAGEPYSNEPYDIYDNYNPDMATGDDNVMVDPNMQIN